MLRFGPDDGPVVVVALPLFEEANRTRAFANAILRALARRRIGGALPDVPGQGESRVPLETLALRRFREGYAAAVGTLGREGRRAYGVGIRSGALLDALAPLAGRWHLAPQDGPDLLRELKRVRLTTTDRRSGDAWYDPGGEPVEIAGNRVSAGLLTDLTVAEPATPDRVVRLASDDRPADRHLAGSPLWRRAEPGSDPVLADAIADDVASWMFRCAAC